MDHGYFAQRWLRAASDLLADPTQRAWALFMHAAACCIHLRFPEAVDSAWTVLSQYAQEITPESLLELEMVYLIALSGTFDTAALTSIAEQGWRTLPGGDGHRAVIRGTALMLLDRWQEADRAFTDTRPVWHADNDAVTTFGLIFSAGIAAFLGRLAEFNEHVADPTTRPLWDLERHRFGQLSALSRMLVGLGELDRNERLLSTYDLPMSQRLPPDQAVTASLSGDWDQALDLARVSLATGSALGYVPVHTLMCREMSVILIARGRLAQARSVIGRVRTEQPVLVHLVAGPESDLENVLGAPDRARRLVVDGLAYAAEHGLVAGTEELWFRMVEWELRANDMAAARRAAGEVARVANQIDTGRARLFELLATALVDQDPAAAAAAIELARLRGQPYELADTLRTVSTRGLAEGKLVLEAYELYGRLDALLPRALLRQQMRELTIAVPGRVATLAENEHLLASLVTEGLTNRELATVLGGSEKSVESRLSRMFQRTGYRSRVELATAMLTGEYSG